MNTRCVPFLALVIWFLLAPPSIEPLPSGAFTQQSPGFPYLKPDAPLLAWLSRGAFPSHVQCDEARTSALHNTKPTVERYGAQLDGARRRSDDSTTPELRSRFYRLRAYYASLIYAKCVAADDPRLVPLYPPEAFFSPDWWNLPMPTPEVITLPN
jgi:hypothetical protein